VWVDTFVLVTLWNLNMANIVIKLYVDTIRLLLCVNCVPFYSIFFTAMSCMYILVNGDTGKEYTTGCVQLY